MHVKFHDANENINSSPLQSTEDSVEQVNCRNWRSKKLYAKSLKCLLKQLITSQKEIKRMK